MTLQLPKQSTPPKLAGVFLIFALMLLLNQRCKAGLTAFTISPDTLSRERTTLDSVKKLLPIGYYIYNEQGARLSLKAKVDADAYFAKWNLATDALSAKTGELFKVTLEKNIAQDQNKTDAETIKTLKRQLFWANFKTWSALSGAAILTVKLILKP